MAARGQRSKANQFDTTNKVLPWHTDSVHLIWTTVGTDVQPDITNTHQIFFIFFLKFKTAAGVRGRNLTNIDHINQILARHTDLVYQIGQILV